MTVEQLLLNLGEFKVDEQGRVWRIAFRGKSCEPRRAEHRTELGYLQVRRMINGRRIHVGAHRLVWTYFNGPIPDGMQINHKNGIKDDNRPENLELSDPSTNASHAHRSGLKDQSGQRNPAAKLSDREVAQIRLAYAQGGYTQAELAKRFGVSYQTISKIVRGERRAKQGGPIGDYSNRRVSHCYRDPRTGRFVGKKAAGRLLDGRTWDELPVMVQ